MKKPLIITIVLLVVIVGGYVAYDQFFATPKELIPTPIIQEAFTPDPVIQAKFDQIFTGSVLIEENVGMKEAFDRATSLVGLTDTNRLELIVQIAYYVENAKTMDEAMGIAALFHYYNFTSDEKLRAVLPYLGSVDSSLNVAFMDFLSTIDRPQGGEPDFSFYESIIEVDDPSNYKALISYMYDVSPRVAVLTLANIYMNNVSEMEILQQATKVIQDAIVTLERKGDEEFRLVLPAASGQLEILSQYEAWWVRLYVAEIIHQVPELQTDELLDLLGSDSNELVRETINQADESLE